MARRNKNLGSCLNAVRKAYDREAGRRLFEADRNLVKANGLGFATGIASSAMLSALKEPINKESINMIEFAVLHLCAGLSVLYEQLESDQLQGEVPIEFPIT